MHHVLATWSVALFLSVPLHRESTTIIPKGADVTPQDPQQPPSPPREGLPSSSPSTRPQPWRTEGLPKSEPPKPRRRWVSAGVWFLAYLAMFGVLTLQDRMSGPQAVPYTEFKGQVGSKNIGEVFARGDSIEGAAEKSGAASRPAGSHLSAVHHGAADIRERRSPRRVDRWRRHGAGDAARPAARLPHQPAHFIRPDSPARCLLRVDVQAPAGSPRWAAQEQAESSRSRVGPRHVRRCRRASRKSRRRSTRSSTS